MEGEIICWLDPIMGAWSTELSEEEAVKLIESFERTGYHSLHLFYAPASVDFRHNASVR